MLCSCSGEVTNVANFPCSSFVENDMHIYHDPYCLNCGHHENCHGSRTTYTDRIGIFLTNDKGKNFILSVFPVKGEKAVLGMILDKKTRKWCGFGKFEMCFLGKKIFSIDVLEHYDVNTIIDYLLGIDVANSSA